MSFIERLYGKNESDGIIRECQRCGTSFDGHICPSCFPSNSQVPVLQDCSNVHRHDNHSDFEEMMLAFMKADGENVRRYGGSRMISHKGKRMSCIVRGRVHTIDGVDHRTEFVINERKLIAVIKKKKINGEIITKTHFFA